MILDDKLRIQCVSCELCFKEDVLGECKHINGILTPVSECTEEEMPVKSKSSFTHSVINMTGMLIGLGQLSNSYGLETGGWLSAFLLVGLGVICAYSACLLGKCLENNPELRSYSDIGQRAFGSRGKVIATTFIYIEIFMGLVSYTISLHDNLNMVSMDIPFEVTVIDKSKLLTVLAVVVTLPSLWLRNLNSIAFLSTGGIIMSMVIFVTVASTAIFGVVKANHSIPVLHLNKIPQVSGLYVFSYAGHVVFPDIYKAMKDPARYTKVAIVSFTAVISSYTALAFIGAKMFGPSINSQITLSMPHDLIPTKIALAATVITPMTKYALQFAPFAIQLERNLPSTMKSRTKMVIRSSIGSIILVAILALALSVPYFQYVLNLTGSLVSITICIIFPCTFYTKIRLTEISKTLLFVNATIVVIGSILSISGTISSSKSLIKAIKTASHP
ncbi:amino acid transporter AVT1H [Silene latifolia]|uniref:amino acid transporter AVT1H n=1 Tax=Silene latifolia TaxID=37657 RepID=UPI003D76CCB0